MDAFLLLSPVAEPDLDHVSVHAEASGHVADLVGGRLGTGGEQRLERLPQQLINVCPLLATSRCHRVERQRRRLLCRQRSRQQFTQQSLIFSSQTTFNGVA